jgi:hypothetical protein
MAHETLTCARCGGHFPAPGVEQEGAVYCCDKCAQGPRRMLPRMLAMGGVLVSLGALLGAMVSKGRPS